MYANHHLLLLIFAFSTLPLVGFSQQITDLRPKDGLAVGDIPFDPALDNADFTLCGGAIQQYYAVSGGYKGGGKRLFGLLSRQSFPNPAGSAGGSGYITVRFVVNCKGQTDRFRVLQVDRNYQSATFDSALVATVLGFTKGLTAWRPGEYQGAYYDYFQYLTFKITDGKVVDILP